MHLVYIYIYIYIPQKKEIIFEKKMIYSVDFIYIVLFTRII